MPPAMTTLGTLTEERGEILRLAERYRASEVRVSGSVGRGDATKAGDVALPVRPQRRWSSSEPGRLGENLQNPLGCPVECLWKRDSSPRVRDEVLRQAILV